MKLTRNKSALILSVILVVAVAAQAGVQDEIEKANSRAKTVVNKVTPHDASVSDLNTDQSNERAQNVINKVQPHEANIPDSKIVPELPGQGMHIKVPESNDPFAVAEMMKSKAQIKTFDPNSAKSAQIAVFVSMSMPAASLKRIALETSKIGGVMVIRGFVNDSMKQTVEAMRPYANLGAEIQINPELFATYGVREVPTFVLAKNTEDKVGCDKEQACSGYLRAEGDASLLSVLESMSNDTKDTALIKLANAKLGQLKGFEEE